MGADPLTIEHELGVDIVQFGSPGVFQGGWHEVGLEGTIKHANNLGTVTRNGTYLWSATVSLNLSMRFMAKRLISDKKFYIVTGNGEFLSREWEGLLSGGEPLTSDCLRLTPGLPNRSVILRQNLEFVRPGQVRQSTLLSSCRHRQVEA